MLLGIHNFTFYIFKNNAYLQNNNKNLLTYYFDCYLLINWNKYRNVSKQKLFDKIFYFSLF